LIYRLKSLKQLGKFVLNFFLIFALMKWLFSSRYTKPENVSIVGLVRFSCGVFGFKVVKGAYTVGLVRFSCGFFGLKVVRAQLFFITVCVVSGNYKMQ